MKVTFTGDDLSEVTALYFEGDIHVTKAGTSVKVAVQVGLGAVYFVKVEGQETVAEVVLEKLMSVEERGEVLLFGTRDAPPLRLVVRAASQRRCFLKCLFKRCNSRSIAFPDSIADTEREPAFPSPHRTTTATTTTTTTTLPGNSAGYLSKHTTSLSAAISILSQLEDSTQNSSDVMYAPPDFSSPERSLLDTQYKVQSYPDAFKKNEVHDSGAGLFTEFLRATEEYNGQPRPDGYGHGYGHGYGNGNMTSAAVKNAALRRQLRELQSASADLEENLEPTVSKKPVQESTPAPRPGPATPSHVQQNLTPRSNLDPATASAIALSAPPVLPSVALPDGPPEDIDVSSLIKQYKAVLPPRDPAEQSYVCRRVKQREEAKGTLKQN
eukprot:TRINITY_DN3520_c9_g1_i1.p1 TRINITY_DN3520_c9_g1~~TRINITY_DN3520_c9_g1_i1.p1  ORF type:complete len:398 (+),score=82.59 TRINITY_DN3520_c9_g1_i1:47-1195(+)